MGVKEMRLVKGLVGALAVGVALFVTDQLYGRQAVFFGRYLTQGDQVAWNGLTFALPKPLALPAAKSENLTVMLFKHDWSGFVPDASMLMRPSFVAEHLSNVQTWCRTKAEHCKEGMRTIAGYPFTYVVFNGTFASISGDHHVHFFSETPAMTITYHGNAHDYQYFDQMLNGAQRMTNG